MKRNPHDVAEEIAAAIEEVHVARFRNQRAREAAENAIREKREAREALDGAKRKVDRLVFQVLNPDSNLPAWLEENAPSEVTDAGTRDGGS